MIEQLYRILEVPLYCNHETIRTAYRQKAKVLHPDVNKSDNAEELFQELNEAYKILNQLTPQEARHLAERLAAQANQPIQKQQANHTTTRRAKRKPTDRNYNNFKEHVNSRIKFIKTAFIFSLVVPFGIGISAFWGVNADHPYVFYICMTLTLFAFFAYFFSMGMKYDPKKKY